MYSRKGDIGETSTASGQRVKKSDPIIEWEGTLDELVSQIAVSKTQIEWEDFVEDLNLVQSDLFHLGEEIITDGKGRKLRSDAVKWMEGRIAVYLKQAGEIKLFVIPGGSPAAASLHLSRAVTRRAERRLVELSLARELNPLILQYLNRLSSLLFSMAIVSNKRESVNETIFPWPNVQKQP